ncbi:MAG: hypothetical protein HRU29_04065 [Rhizobiales bacterium]|nr:hypothetical protein [Hyphomicrobiales bacterium]NRB13557.1 hypothetical protein [Hyphomicrobiales bacterium]
MVDNHKKSSLADGYKNILFIVLLGVGLGLTPFFASAGEVTKTLLQKSLEKGGVSEKSSKQISEYANILFDGVREYSRGFAPKPGTARSSVPNPVEPLVAVAANIDTIACATLLVAIRQARTRLHSHIVKDMRDPTVEEFKILNNLRILEGKVEQGCAARNEDKPVKPKIETVVDEPISIYPSDWTNDDIACLNKCYIPHLTYTRLAENNLEAGRNTLRDAQNKVGRLVGDLSTEIMTNPFLCEIDDSALNKAKVDLKSKRLQLEENLKTIERRYQREVVDCVKKCPVRVQIRLVKFYARSPSHIEFDEYLLNMIIAETTLNMIIPRAICLKPLKFLAPLVPQ